MAESVRRRSGAGSCPWGGTPRSAAPASSIVHPSAWPLLVQEEQNARHHNQFRLEQALSSNLLVGPRMAVSFGIELHHRFMDGAVEVLRSGEGLVSEVMPLQVA